ncbi:MAG: hypothetical protein QXO16_07540 [Archaeoglobaceae archaeon]
MWVRRCWEPKVAQPAGYEYVGSCRCERDSHAFYRDPSGRIAHAWELYHQLTPTKEDLKAELQALKEEKERLEKRIEELEKKLKEERKEQYENRRCARG